MCNGNKRIHIWKQWGYYRKKIEKRKNTKERVAFDLGIFRVEKSLV
jgi:DNA-directed RNA polymerase subunit N (RpoN/RPB10)